MPYENDQLQKAALAGIEIRQSTLTEKLEDERQQIATRLAEIDALLDQLNAHPEVQGVLDALQKLVRIY